MLDQQPHAAESSFRPIGAQTTHSDERSGRLVRVRDGRGTEPRFGYDLLGSTRTTLPDGKTITTSYTAANQPASIQAWDGSTTQLAYDGNGRLSTVTRPNGVTTTTSYDDAGRITQIQHAGASGTLDKIQYQYDAAGRRVGMIDSTRTLTYTFDGLDRLIQATSSDGTPYQYTYDAAGNRLSAMEGSHSTTAAYDVANQLTSVNGVATSSDANGNLLSDPSTGSGGLARSSGTLGY